ncbi:MAG: hypothetical protein ACLT98_06970 [Eggerthellaceae bacterium]
MFLESLGDAGVKHSLPRHRLAAQMMMGRQAIWKPAHPAR